MNHFGLFWKLFLQNLVRIAIDLAGAYMEKKTLPPSKKDSKFGGSPWEMDFKLNVSVSAKLFENDQNLVFFQKRSIMKAINIL